MEPLLTASVKTTLGPARVVWMSSIEASPEGYDPADWQLLRTPETYALSKFQTDLLATRLDSTGAPVRHMLVQPGVVATSILANALNWFTTLAMLAAFYIVRRLTHARVSH
jgi:3-keto steroid reductase